MKRVVCGIVGAGVIAPVHLKSYQQLPDVTVKYIADLEIDKAEKLAKEYSVEHAIVEYQTMLSDDEVNCISVCTDHASHAQIVADALNAGKHVICEKCLAATPEQLKLMLDTHAQHPKLKFGGIFQHRHEPCNNVLRKNIENGNFGKILNASLHVTCLRTDEYYTTDAWRGTWQHEGGSVLINQAIHHFDLMRFFFGEVEELCATYNNAVHTTSIETEDSIVVILRFKSGMLATVSATSGCQPEKWRSVYTISGTEGYIEYLEFTPNNLKLMTDEATSALQEEFTRCNEDAARLLGKNYYGNGHAAQIADFVEAIRENREPFVTGEISAGTAKLVHACYKSAQSGSWVKI